MPQLQENIEFLFNYRAADHRGFINRCQGKLVH